MVEWSAENRGHVERLIAARQQGHGLPGRFYSDELLYREEMDTIWRRGWLLAGHTCQVTEPGDYFTYEVDGDSILLIRGDHGRLHAHYNTCRHRGMLVCPAAAGHAGRLVCPYHQWVYARDGALLTCRGMQEDLDKAELGLLSVAVEELAGMIFICLADNPPDFSAARALIEPVARPQGLQRAKVAKIVDYTIAANWKLIWENNRECFHCNANHPQYIKANFDHYNADDTTEEIRRQLDAQVAESEKRWAAAGLAVTHHDSGMTCFPDAENNIWYSANRTPLVDGYVSESMDGRQVAPLMGDYTDNGVGTVRIRTVPNMWNHSSCDHGVTTRLTPSGPRSTHARVIWLVNREAEESRDYELDKLMPFWQLTSEQDWEICENNQRGVSSRAFRPGPYSRYKEYNVDSFVGWYLRQLEAGMGE